MEKPAGNNNKKGGNGGGSLFGRQLSHGSASGAGEKIWIDPYTNERVWVFNPMHIVHLTKQTKSRFVRIVEGFKAFSNKWFSHVLLLLFLILYGFLGAYIFMTLEGPYEDAAKVPVKDMREGIIKELWWGSHKFNKGWWEKLARIRLREYEMQLHQSCLQNQTTSSEQKIWSFWQSLFFSSTIFTTIGYGHVVPKTEYGRIASILYAFIGIPLLLMVLTDLGKLFTRGIKFVFKYFRKLYNVRQIRRMRRATLAPTQFVSQTMDAVNRKMSTVVPLRGRLFSKDLGAGADASNPAPAGGLQTIDESTTFTDDETLAEEFEVDDEFNLPISVAVTLLLLYMMAGAAVFTIWEKWTFFESFYFVYISLSTIGFGDYVPEHPAFMMCTFIYLLFGLALTSMCINVVQEKLSATFQKAKLRIGATMGLDMTAMMEEELNQDETSVLQMNNNNNNNNNPNPKPILKDEGIGDALREKREKKRKMSAVEKKGGDDKKEVDGGGKGGGDVAAADKPKGKGGKSVDFK